MAIRLEGVSKSYLREGRKHTVLNNITLCIADGESVAVVGRSGIGKSTLINMIAGYLRPDEGEILFNGHSILGPSTDRIVVSQADSLFPWLDVYSNAAYASLVGKGRVNRKAIRVRTEQLLKRFGLWSHRDKFPKSLSGGERRRVELIRAFVAQPSLILLDEPHTSLDEALANDLRLYLKQWRITSPTCSVLLVTHDLNEACSLADRVIVLSGEPGTVFREVPVSLLKAAQTDIRQPGDYDYIVAQLRNAVVDSQFSEQAGAE